MIEYLNNVFERLHKKLHKKPDIGIQCIKISDEVIVSESFIFILTFFSSNTFLNIQIKSVYNFD